VGPRDRPHLTPQRLRRRLPQPPAASQGGVYPSRRCVLSPDEGRYSAHTFTEWNLRPGPPATPSAAALAPRTSAASPRPTREAARATRLSSRSRRSSTPAPNAPAPSSTAGTGCGQGTHATRDAGERRPGAEGHDARPQRRAGGAAARSLPDRAARSRSGGRRHAGTGPGSSPAQPRPDAARSRSSNDWSPSRPSHR
jgi:hypothetical protein